MAIKSSHTLTLKPYNATLTLQAQRQAIEEWSVASFRPECRTKRTVGSKKVATGAAAGSAPALAETREVVHQQMASLTNLLYSNTYVWIATLLYKPYCTQRWNASCSTRAVRGL